MLFFRAYKVLKRFELSSPQLRQNILKSLSKAGRHWLFIQGKTIVWPNLIYYMQVDLFECCLYHVNDGWRGDGLVIMWALPFILSIKCRVLK